MRAQQTGVNRKGKDEHDREDNEGKAGPDSPGLIQELVCVHGVTSRRRAPKLK